MTMGAQSAMAGAPAKKQGFKHFTPYSRVAQLPVVRVQGEIDYPATYAKAKAASTVPGRLCCPLQGLGGAGRGCHPRVTTGCWAGLHWTCRKTQTCTDDEIAHAILEIPSPEPIDPNDPAYLADGTVTKANTKKANVLDFCNEHYAKQALGVAPIVGDKKVVNGYSHTPALPCEVSIWNDDKHIYVDMLDPNAIFTLFFTDVLISEDMADRDFADAISALPPQVKAEIKAIVQHAMSEFDPDAESLDKALGPRYTQHGAGDGCRGCSPGGLAVQACGLHPG